MLLGILCTYRRHSQALRYLDSLERQTVPPDIVAVVDNSPSDELRDAILQRPSHHTAYRYLQAGANVGPAGAFRLGFDDLAPLASPTDLIIHFDDDDPPVADDIIERLVGELSTAIQTDGRVGGMGLTGGVLNTHTGLLRQPDRATRVAIADHLDGCHLPVFRASALADVCSHDPSFFFGFEELELGRRLRARGWKLLVSNGLMWEYESLQPKRVAAQQGTLPELPSWKRFHGERNLLRIFHRERLWSAIIFTVVVRHLAKPIALMCIDPPRGWHRLVIGIRATIAGLRGSTGIDPRYPPP